MVATAAATTKVQKIIDENAVGRFPPPFSLFLSLSLGTARRGGWAVVVGRRRGMDGTEWSADGTTAVFAKSYCPYCRASKSTLSDLGARFYVLELDQIGTLCTVTPSMPFSPILGSESLTSGRGGGQTMALISRMRSPN